MADAYWKFGDGRHQPAAVQPQVAKRPRPEYDMPSGTDISPYYPREEERGGHQVIRDTDSINASYENYLRKSILSYGSEPAKSVNSVPVGLNYGNESRIIPNSESSDILLAAKSRPLTPGGRSEIRLPHDASSTLFVEGLPANCTRREVSHIFRPFVGYKEVRLISKEARRSGGDPLVLCFVDFQSPAHAATSMDALQGYKFDEHERDSTHLRLQFARNPGVRSGAGNRGKR